jgi:hypothetical protein
MAFPVDVFDVVIALHGQAIATLKPAGLEHLTPIGSSHTGTKAVHAHPVADPRLIHSLRHNNVPYDKMSLKRSVIIP